MGILLGFTHSNHRYLCQANKSVISDLCLAKNPHKTRIILGLLNGRISLQKKSYMCVLSSSVPNDGDSYRQLFSFLFINNQNSKSQSDAVGLKLVDLFTIFKTCLPL